AAETANRSKTDFLAVMSHELRTPLNAIGGYAELLELGVYGEVNDVQRDAIHRLQKSQRHLLSLITEVLNYARIESGTTQFDLTDIGVGLAMAMAEALVVPQARSKELALVVKYADPEVTVHADGEKLQQILLNLLSNAVKFTDRGEITMSVDASLRSVSFTVADTGIGIPPEKLDSVFEPFVQIDPNLTRTSQGVGLGLAISRDLARRMGGDLHVESQLGVGSTFELTLPR
ncbi:MAG: HAMP domain-containing histidine kinase, partial [Anaerolineae bacterium]|nr:HAMP domain-containing histidine kinase [Gemmatimonadaceae bacterium]